MTKICVAVGFLAIIGLIFVYAGGHSPVDVATDEHSPATLQAGPYMARLGEGVCEVWGPTPREQVRPDRPWTQRMTNGLYCHYWDVQAGSGFYRDATGSWHLRWVDDPAAARKSGIQLRNPGFVQLIG